MHRRGRLCREDIALFTITIASVRDACQRPGHAFGGPGFRTMRLPSSIGLSLRDVMGERVRPRT